MHKKLLSAAVTVAMVGGLLAIGPAAQAAPPFAATNFNPQDAITVADADGTDTLILSDKFDGVDQQAHLTSVATSDATSATYVICPPGGFAGGTTVPPAGCDVIGTDTEGVQAAGFQGDKGFEFFWNIPFQYDEITRDIGTYHCTGAPGAVEPGTNCTLDFEPGVFVDDAQTATDSSGAELIDYCVDANSDGDCEAADGDTTPKPLGHPTDVPNLSAYPGGQYLVTARGSADIGILTLCVDSPADAQNDPDACSFSDSSGAAAAGAFNNYTFTVTGPDNTEQSWWLHDLTGGDGACATDATSCLLDNHYVVSSAPTAVEAVVSFDTAGASCAAPDDAETNDLGDSEDVFICLTDQFGDPFNGPVTFESSGVATAGFSACPGGTLHDHDGDGYDEQCHATTGADGIAEATIDNPGDLSATGPAVPGTQTVTGCSDTENFGTEDAPPVEHGCADETATDSVAKTWVTHPTHVHLVFAGTGDPADPCHSGDQFKENETGDTDDLLVCTFDDFHNAIGTEAPGDGRLQWFIVPSGGGELTATRFATPPPSDTGADGTAAATLEAFRGGNDVISVELSTDAGGTLSTDSVQKRVTQGPQPVVRVDSSVTIRDRFRGRVNSTNARCRRGRLVKVKKVRPGRDRTIGQDRTNRRGRYVVRRPGANGRFYAKAVKKRIVRPNRIIVCRAARSRTIRR